MIKNTAPAMDLLAIYHETLSRCAPERLVREGVPLDAPHDVVAIGKAAGALLDGVAAVHRIDNAFVAIPGGYKRPQSRADVAIGGHPDLTAESFAAGQRLLDFVDAHRDILFLVAGGGSACVDVSLAPFTERDLIDVNARVVASGLPIGDMNVIRKHLSAIKGGRLGARVKGRTVTLVYSDVSAGALADVASGPTLPDSSTKSDAIRLLQSIGGCDRIVTMLGDTSVAGTVHHIENARAILVADNDTLVSVAASVAGDAGLHVERWPSQIEMDVEAAAEALAGHAERLAHGEIVVAGGEPTVVRRGEGRGGRCSELAVRFAMAAQKRGLVGLTALFGSTDGVDGSSGAAGVFLRRVAQPLDAGAVERALRASDSMAIAAQIGEPIMITATGNNLRDMYLVARG
jgi:glycerate 2-kinase